MSPWSANRLYKYLYIFYSEDTLKMGYKQSILYVSKDSQILKCII